MINQLANEAFVNDHRQVLVRKAQANCMIRRVQADSSNTNRRPGTFLSRLKSRRVSQQNTFRPSKKGELDLGFE